MGYSGHSVIDMDCHIYQAWDLDRTYKDNIAPEYREKYARFSEAVRGCATSARRAGLRRDLLAASP